MVMRHFFQGLPIGMIAPSTSMSPYCDLDLEDSGVGVGGVGGGGDLFSQDILAHAVSSY